MKKLGLWKVLCLAFILVGSSCYSSKVSNNNKNSTNDSNNTNNTVQQKPEYYLPFVSSINLVDPTNPYMTISIPQEASKEVKAAVIGWAVKSFDSKSGTFKGLHYDSLFWYEQDPFTSAGGYYKIKLTKDSQKPSKVRISADSDFCPPKSWYYDPIQRKGYILSYKIDPNRGCYWNRNTDFYFIHTNMQPTDSPILIGKVAGFYPLIGSLTDPSIKAFVIIHQINNGNNTELKFSRCDLNISSCKYITSFRNVEILSSGWNPKRGEIFFCIRDKNFKVKTIAISLNSFQEFNSTCIDGSISYDGNYIFSIYDGEMLSISRYNPDDYSHINRVGFDDSEGIYYVEKFYFTQNYIIVPFFNGKTTKLIAFPKSGGSKINLSDNLKNSLPSIYIAGENKVFFNDAYDGACIWDGSTTKCFGKSTYWMGFTIPENGSIKLLSFNNYEFTPLKLFKVSRNILESYDPISENQMTVANLTPGFEYYFKGVGNIFLFQGTSSADNTDIFFMDLSSEVDPLRITSTPNKIEKPIFPFEDFDFLF